MYTILSHDAIHYRIPFLCGTALALALAQSPSRGPQTHKVCALHAQWFTDKLCTICHRPAM